MQYDEPMPILKWAGGKSQLIEDIIKVIPKEFGKNINKYVEPFVGGGAMLFYILSHYNVKEVHISDINSELINMYSAIKANADMFSENVFVIPDMASLEKLSTKLKSIKRIGVVIQTTQKLEFLQEVVNYLIPIANELKVFNTICQSTAKRQQEAKELAKTSDLMIVVGGKNSANTTHLAEILNEITTTIHIETQEDLDEYKSIIEKSQNIGVTAGASTPENIIKSVIDKLNEI